MNGELLGDCPWCGEEPDDDGDCPKCGASILTYPPDPDEPA